MRIWSLHPKYLDSRGLVALWRETLLAKNVLEDKTSGYRNHPQLERFKNAAKPLDAINGYLSFVYAEAERRHYKFDKNKFVEPAETVFLSVTSGQLNYEFSHLLIKLKTRDPVLYDKAAGTKTIDANPMFKVVQGEPESWEKIKTS